MQDHSSILESTIAKNLDMRLKEAVRRSGGAKRVASATGFGESTIYNYLKLKPAPPIDFVYALAECADVRGEWLFLGSLPVSDDDDTGDWETKLPNPAVGEKRVPVRDVAASAGHGGEIFQEDPAHCFTFPIEWLMNLGDPDSMDILRVEGDSMFPELADGDHVMIDHSQRMVKDGLFVVLVDEHLFLKRIRIRGRGRAELVSTNPAYPPFEISLPDAGDEVAQDGAAIVGKVVWVGRSI